LLCHGLFFGFGVVDGEMMRLFLSRGRIFDSHTLVMGLPNQLRTNESQHIVNVVRACVRA
jgi:hypothetical protein